MGLVKLSTHLGQWQQGAQQCCSDLLVMVHQAGHVLHGRRRSRYSLRVCASLQNFSSFRRLLRRKRRLHAA